MKQITEEEEINILLSTIQKNHQWHLDYDDIDGYKGSYMEQTNLKGIKILNGLKD